MDSGIRKKVIGSGAGIAVALVVILLFVFAATFLKSLVFGIIAAATRSQTGQYCTGK